jgi:hypothetical protein
VKRTCAPRVIRHHHRATTKTTTTSLTLIENNNPKHIHRTLFLAAGWLVSELGDLPRSRAHNNDAPHARVLLNRRIPRLSSQIADKSDRREKTTTWMLGGANAKRT